MKYILITASALCFVISMDAQTINNNVIASGGTSLKKGNMQLEYTLGETCINTLSSSSNKITQGFHQPNIVVARIAASELPENISELTSTSDEKIAEDLSLNIFPNPTTDFVNITSESTVEINLTLIDASGKIIQNLKHNSNQTQIDFTSIKAGTYFIVAQSGNAKNTYKVIKIH